MKDLDALELVDSESGREQVKSIKLSSSVRWRQTKRALVKYARAVKKAATGKVKFSARASCALEALENEHAPCNLAGQGTELKQFLEAKLDEKQLDLLDSDDSSLRNKRATFLHHLNTVFSGLLAIGVLVGVIALFFFC